MSKERMKNLITRRFCINAIVIIILMLLSNTNAFANNLAIENATITSQNTSAQTCKAQFDAAWGNSWRNGINRDAVWIFIKYSTDSGSTWSHATLKTSGTNPSGFSQGSGTGLDIVVTTDKKGAFIERSSNNNAMESVDTDSIQFVWDWGTDGLSADDAVRLRIFGIEMVYIPAGSFYIGDGTNRTGGTDSHFFDAGDSSDPRSAVEISETQPYISDKNDGTGTVGDITWVNESGFAGNLPVARTQLNANYPTGYNAFYIMKYEISQGQYADFLNTITSTQASTRFPNSNGISRHTISGTHPNHSASRPERGCNYLSWMDLCAYGDWAALRPFTELEFEKVCRGREAFIAGEYSWGDTYIEQATTISGTEDGTETITNSGANCHYDSVELSGGDGGEGPLRCGIFATSSSARQASGAGYYGVMEFSGNLWERPVSVMASSTGSTLSEFTGVHGDGSLSTNGNANTSNWPGLSGSEVTDDRGGFRGGSFGDDEVNISNRYAAAPAVDTGRDAGLGGRCARTAP